MAQMQKSQGSISMFDREYAKARKHSKFVQIMKYMLPVTALLIFSLFIAFSVFISAVPEGLVIEGAAIEDGKIIMRSPVVAGQNSDGLPYRMKAEKAIQEIGNSSIVTLDNIEAELLQKDGSTARISALEGIFNQDDEILTFTQPFSVHTSSGMAAKFGAAVYDLAAGEFVSQRPVDINFSSGSATANAITITDNGSKMNLNGDVKMTIIPQNLRN